MCPILGDKRGPSFQWSAGKRSKIGQCRQSHLRKRSDIPIRILDGEMTRTSGADDGGRFDVSKMRLKSSCPFSKAINHSSSTHSVSRFVKKEAAIFLLVFWHMVKLFGHRLSDHLHDDERTLLSLPKNQTITVQCSRNCAGIWYVQLFCMSVTH